MMRWGRGRRGGGRVLTSPLPASPQNIRKSLIWNLCGVLAALSILSSLGSSILRMSHSFIVWSLPLEMKWCPSPLDVTHVTPAWCPQSPPTYIQQTRRQQRDVCLPKSRHCRFFFGFLLFMFFFLCHHFICHFCSFFFPFFFVFFFGASAHRRRVGH